MSRKSRRQRALTAMELGTRMHQEIERVMRNSHCHGDSHIGQGDAQLLAYAHAAGLHEVHAYIAGGDLLHGDYDVERLIGHERTLLLVPDLLHDPLTGRIKPTVNDDE